MKLNQIYNENCLDTMRRMPDNFLHCVVTSPPYWGLRDYGTDGQQWPAVSYSPMPGLPELEIPAMTAQLGLEETPEAFVGHIIHIFREVRRVLRDDGTLWLNFGDSYAGGKTGRSDHGCDDPTVKLSGNSNGAIHCGYNKQRKPPQNLKPKDLCGIPWRVAFALQADGWWLRSDIIWAKPNPMPESVTDRPTKAHEYLFLLTKNARYYYDAEAVKEKQGELTRRSKSFRSGGEYTNNRSFNNHIKVPNATHGDGEPSTGRNRRTVWTIATKPYSGAHFAVFPPDLVKPCVLAGSPQKVCSECGAGWERVVERDGQNRSNEEGIKRMIENGVPRQKANLYVTQKRGTSKTIGWQPSCTCNATPTKSIVYDPFGGSGTTAEVAHQYGRSWIVSEISAEYVKDCTKPRLEKTKQKVLF